MPSLHGLAPRAKIACMGDDRTPAEKLRTAFDLFEAGLDLMRQNLRRRHPAATQAELDGMLQEWLLTRPGAEHGDGPPGRLRDPEEPAA